MKSPWIQQCGLVASIILPFFNLPLMIRIIRRRSADDVSLVWVIGVYVCFLIMLPAGLTTSDPVFKGFTIANLIFFSGVFFSVVYFRIIVRKK